MTRPLPTEAVLLRGAAGNIEALIDAPATVKGSCPPGRSTFFSSFTDSSAAARLTLRR